MMSIYKPFFGTQFKAVAFLLTMIGLFTWPILGTQAQDDDPDNRELLVDLIDGGADLFNQINHGVIQIFTGASGGSGYIIDKEGHAITNRHVTDGNPYFEIAFWGEQEQSRNLGYRHKGVLIAEDPALDMALIQVQAPQDKFYPVKLGESGKMVAGDVVATCGSPGGEAGDVNPSNWAEGWLEYFNLNVGVLTEILPFESNFGFALFGDSSWSQTRREYYASAVEYCFHVDAAINHGNSGGPCFNAYGEAIGTNTWGAGPGVLENWGVSVPTDLLKKSAADIIAYGHVRRPWVGISFNRELYNSDVEDLFNTGAISNTFWAGIWFDPRPKELKILVVNPYSPAYEAGLREGDIVDRIDDKKMDYILDIYAYFLHAKLGQEIEFKIRRGEAKRPITFIVTVDEKKIRYFGADINNTTQVYHAPLTY